MSTLTITARHTATGPVLELNGDLDHATSPQLRAATAHSPLSAGQLLVLDLSGLEFCDSSGITALLAARSLALERSADVALAALPANTARSLALIGLDRVFTIHPDTSTALAVGSTVH